MDVITIGDALITMNPQTSGPLRFVNTFERKIGGAELNVAIGCSRLGLKTGWISRLGNDEFGRYISSYARGEGIDTSKVELVNGFPTSVYFKEILNEERINSYYYRHNSPTNVFKVEDIDEEYVKNSKVVHISGVFPAINDTNKDIVLQLVKLAKKNNVIVTFDPNIRLKLWSGEKAKAVLQSFLPFVDVLITGEEEAELLLGSTNIEELIELGKHYDISHIVLKRGEKGAIGYKGGELIDASPVISSKIVDTIGAGDGFATGYIYSLINDWSLERSLRFANAVACYVIGVPGDNEGLPYLEDMAVILGEKEQITR
ncbi:2-keto-3-deoxygluconate kinase [Lysinibacillus contaminans]|uniref:2-keto-3-deoxygluconate kinase n=1 Tax=Lysinibacillus contaminans TaxID=1293441 RepID=A0ABR5K171_9BACI|nr:sugar kinase [Lysinibacillus contaminans]KOS68658.1 2-keto-3-deoxygluconate kinase [Lysinibacillus contaminans]